MTRFSRGEATPTPHSPQILDWRNLIPYQSPTFWATVGLFGLIFTIELLTPADYVIGYLYISPILFAKPRMNSRTIFLVTAIAVGLTLLNIWIPAHEEIHAAMVTNRLITVLALVATGILSDRNRHIHTTLAQQQAQLQVQAKLASLREDFTSTLTHDLKTPILGAVETLKAFSRERFGQIQPQQKQVLETIVRSHQTSLKLVETLLDVYRNDISGLQLQRNSIDLGKLAESTTTVLFDLAASRRVHLSLHYEDSDFRKFLWIDGDAFQLERVFANLITNAINHSPRGAKVEIVLGTQAGYHLVKIIDTGAGIQPHEMAHLFDRFYQGEGDRQASGSGLGLYLSRQIVDAHNGTIWAENRSTQGAIFGFRIPAIIDPSYPVA
jgi:two-component system, NarL family, sensor kinase